MLYKVIELSIDPKASRLLCLLAEMMFFSNFKVLSKTSS